MLKQKIGAKPAYFTVTEHGRSRKKVVFIFGGWRFGNAFYRLLLRDLTKKGYKCILYKPDPKLIGVGSPYQGLIDADRFALHDVLKRISRESAAGATEFVSLGMSMGTAFAAELAKASPEISKLVLLAPFGDFSEHIALWYKHKFHRKILQSQPLPLKESAELLNQISILNHLEKLRDKQILICYSTDDSMVHTAVTRRLVAALRQICPHTEVALVGGSHVGGILRHLYLKKSHARLLGSN